MSNESRSMKQQLNDAAPFLKNIQKEDLLYSFKARKVDNPSLEEGEKLYADTLRLMEEKRKLKTNYSEANLQFLKASEEARKYYHSALYTARRYTREEWIHQALEVKG